MGSSKPIIVLVPGWFLGTDVYYHVEKLLHQSGFETKTVTMPSAGKTSPGNPSWYDDAAAVRGVVEPLIEKDGKDVVLVCHSSGGAIAAESTERLAKKQRQSEGKKGGVCHFVFLAAAIFPMGFTPSLDMMPVLQVNGGEFTCKDAQTTLMNDLSDSDAKTWLSRFRCQPADDYLRAVTHTGWADVSSTYVISELDNTVPVPIQEGGAALAGSKIERLNVGHFSMLKDPAAVANIIQNSAAQG